MKTLFTRLLLGLLMAAPLSFISCGDDDENLLENKETSCSVSKVESLHNGTTVGSSQITYNSQGYVTKMEITEGFGSQSPTVSVRNYVYNAQNQLVRINFLQDLSRIDGYNTYEYNANGTISKESRYNGTTLSSANTYTYDGSKRMVQLLMTFDGFSSKATYEYVGTTQNILKETYYTQNGTTVSGYRVYSDYDDKLNPVFMTKGLPLNGESRNNHSKEVYTSADGQSTRTDSYTYTYNTDGAVTEIIKKASWSRTEYKSLYTYRCN